ALIPEGARVAGCDADLVRLREGSSRMIPGPSPQPSPDQFQRGLGRPMANPLPVAREAKLAHLSSALVGQRDVNQAHRLFSTATGRAGDARDADPDGGSAAVANAFGQRLGGGFGYGAMGLQQGRRHTRQLGFELIAVNHYAPQEKTGAARNSGE